MAGSPVQLSVEGEGLAALQRKLKAMEGGKLLARELNKGLKDAAKPLIPDARAAARSSLPKKGGLAERIGSGKISIRVSAAKREPGVKVVVKGHDAISTNSGRLRHPVYADAANKTRDEWTWVSQRIDPGWFTDTMKLEGRKVTPHLLAAMERTAEKIARA